MGSGTRGATIILSALPITFVSSENSELSQCARYISVVLLEDIRLRKVINTMALYVLDGGCAFEQAIMERRVETERTLTDAQRDEFEDMLRALTLERIQIKEAMVLLNQLYWLHWLQNTVNDPWKIKRSW
uniref:SURP motif domain-containing protein n=1 Tax=Lactuca sativa TaxID=4236 RepID=A0A9R1X374_LACSA|nr:hypothetical protein LSAT_V11C700343250 [Lactuca sativa]